MDIDLYKWPTRLSDSRVIMHCTVYGEPVSKARPRVTKDRRTGNVYAYNPPGNATAERALSNAMKEAMRTEGPDDKHTFGLRASFYFGTSQRRDVDNLVKLVGDAANKVVWLDDHQVTEVHALKFLAQDEARTEVVIYKTGELAPPSASCKTCGKTFRVFPSWRNRDYCTKQCWSQGVRTGKDIPCEACGSPVYRTAYSTSSGKRNFCSVKCKQSVGVRRETCAQCGAAFEMAQTTRKNANEFCTRECSAAWYKDHPAKVAVGRCQDCGGPTSRREYTRCRGCKTAAPFGGTSNFWDRRKV